MSQGKGLQHRALALCQNLEFMQQPRLADPGLAQCGYQLPVTRFNESQCAFQLFKLILPSDEFRESTFRRKLKVRPQRPESRDLEDPDRFTHSAQPGSP